MKKVYLLTIDDGTDRGYYVISEHHSYIKAEKIIECWNNGDIFQNNKFPRFDIVEIEVKD